MKMIKYRLDPIAFFFKCFLEIGVHVAGNSLYSFHPVHADMIDEIVYDLFCLSFGDPEDMASLHVNDVGRIPIPVMATP